MADSSAIDQALMDVLLNDADLRALLPDGVFWEEAGASLLTGLKATRFAIVSLVDSHEAPRFGATAYEDTLYLVKAVVLSTIVGGNVQAAAARIQALLHYGRPTIPDYGLMVLRRESRIRMTEVDDRDSAIRWYHRGGRYQLMAAPAAA